MDLYSKIIIFSSMLKKILFKNKFNYSREIQIIYMILVIKSKYIITV